MDLQELGPSKVPVEEKNALLLEPHKWGGDEGDPECSTEKLPPPFSAAACFPLPPLEDSGVSPPISRYWKHFSGLGEFGMETDIFPALFLFLGLPQAEWAFRRTPIVKEGLVGRTRFFQVLGSWGTSGLVGIYFSVGGHNF